MLGLFVLPLLSVFLRSINAEFFDYAFSQQALSALKLSLVTSTVTTICAILFGTPLAYILANWKLK
ncbi:MAG TPA: molybdate ABC transporter permease subunit, partial [Anaerolineae bacterium]|nr:molybdate ABC transporter permease subunit [Anaerolineae bacterium]